ncbi:MAG: efflux transporter outer membrane subunit [Pseudomonadota bacterium]|nr:efflux transporter outer membrane subunit [Pseudomonadota bacterium]
MRLHSFLTALAAALLAGCALSTPPAQVDAPIPAQFFAPLPHHGSVTDLTQWWQSQGDPLLAQLIAAGQEASPTVAAAATRIAQARGADIAARAALLPRLDGSASVSRGDSQIGIPLGTTSQVGLQSAWELDLFGGARQARRRTSAQLQGARAGWHEARVAVAADIANQYVALRACQQLVAINAADASSREDTARLAQLSATAGFTAPASAALARASAAESSSRLNQQRAACDLNIKALVALSAIDEPTLRTRLAAPSTPMPAPITVASLPAEILRQRPDVFAAEQTVAAASAAVGSAEAARYPRLSLSGSIGTGNFRAGGVNTHASTWTIGPLALTLPLFDGGVRRADVASARASYDEAAITYRAKVRQAVREVEEALVNLDSAQTRSDDAQRSVDGYRISFEATESRYRSGLASLVELEDARRLRLAAEIAQVTLQQQRSAAWIALYRTAGGGWQAPDKS